MGLRLFFVLFVSAMTIAVPARAQAPTWSRSDLEQLLEVVAGVGEEGLDSSDYDGSELKAALASGTEAAIGSSATAIFMHVAADFSSGHVADRARLAWHIKGPTLDEAARLSLLHSALASHQVRQSLKGLLPTNSEYLRLKQALKDTPARDKAAVQRLRANLERWRWMPRDLGRRYLLVNVAAFEVALVEDSKVLARHRVIVGKTETPTPQFAAMVDAIQFNPSWYVPKSIVAESVGALVRTQPEVARMRGYVISKNGIRQRPGPDNALGAMKLVMPNPFSVYLHDTPNKGLFAEEVRAFSHGCIRTEDPITLAVRLLASPNWERAVIDRTVKTRVTTTVPLAQPLPIYVTYFTAATDEAGEVASFPDIYSRDAPVVAALIDREQADPIIARADR